MKYELDKDSGEMVVDRFLHTAMFYPANYGFIPHTLSEDGDPLDCMVISATAVVPNVTLPSRPIGALHGFVLDGFPRSLPQADALDRRLAEKSCALDAVIALKVDDAILLDRVRQRAAQSGAAVRPDDTAETLRRRLDFYHQETAPLLAFYGKSGLLRTVDGMTPIECVARSIEACIADIRIGVG